MSLIEEHSSFKYNGIMRDIVILVNGHSKKGMCYMVIKIKTVYFEIPGQLIIDVPCLFACHYLSIIGIKTTLCGSNAV